MPRSALLHSIDSYVSDVLLRDLVGHDKRPAAFLIYFYLYSRSARARWNPVSASLRDLAEETGLSKSAVQISISVLQHRRLIATTQAYRTATPAHRVHRPWRD